MVQKTIREQLALAERHIRDGEYHLARLHELAALHYSRGIDADSLRAKLDHEERQQRMRTMDHGRLIAILVWFEKSALERKAR
ncbi:Exonuclease SbcC [Hyphomicrobiales bacterium]|nr:Exonuclease SbcC [Hyphomicrobiales bacterium]CAH1693284.1 Exonuclease SbcC [Hyphomicrobiales bacterium]